MASDNNTDNNNPPQTAQSFEYPEELKERARAYFAKGAETAYALNFDYAIELYLDGLSFWPEALDEGHKPLREIALRRQANGGKKAGFADGSKYKKASSKNPRDAMLKAEYLLSKDPANMSHMAEMVKAAAAGGYKESGLWIANLLFERNRQQDKPNFATYTFLKDSYIQLDNFARALQCCQMALQLKPNDASLQDVMRDLSAQATMQQGKYDNEGGDFRDSIQNRDSQDKLHSQEQLIQTDDMKTDAITAARQAYEADPNIPGKITNLVDALCRTEKPDNESEAIQILDKAYESSNQFHYKQRSGEIIIKQLQRSLRQIKSESDNAPDDPELKKQYQQIQKKALIAELEHNKLCVENYPTDMKLKHEYGKTLFRARKFDEAIPLFQQSVNDPRFRISSLKFTGQCFYYMEWFPDAVTSFSQALEQLQSGGDDALKKELLYNLGRAYEADKQLEEAINCYRKVAQIDFNYLDVRSRIETLRKKDNG